MPGDGQKKQEIFLKECLLNGGNSLAHPKRNRSPEERVPVPEDQAGISRDWLHYSCWHTAPPCGDRALLEEYSGNGVLSKESQSVSTKYSGIMLIMVLV